MPHLAISCKVPGSLRCANPNQVIQPSWAWKQSRMELSCVPSWQCAAMSMLSTKLRLRCSFVTPAAASSTMMLNAGLAVSHWHSLGSQAGSLLVTCPEVAAGSRQVERVRMQHLHSPADSSGRWKAAALSCRGAMACTPSCTSPHWSGSAEHLQGAALLLAPGLHIRQGCQAGAWKLQLCLTLTGPAGTEATCGWPS